MKITEDTKVCEVLEINEKLEAIFIKHNMNCLGCPGALQESIKEAADGHDVDVNVLIRDLNKEM